MHISDQMNRDEHISLSSYSFLIVQDSSKVTLSVTHWLIEWQTFDVKICWLVPQDFNNETIGFSPICIACFLFCFWVRKHFTFLCVRSVTLDSINGKMIRFSSFLINWMNWYNQLLAPLGALIAIPFQWIDTTWERLISPSLRGAPAEKTCCSNGIQLFHCIVNINHYRDT